MSRKSEALAFFNAQNAKRVSKVIRLLPVHARTLQKVRANVKTMIDLASDRSIDRSLVLSAVNDAARTAAEVEKALGDMTAQVQKDIDTLPKEKRREAAREFNKAMEAFEKKHLDPAFRDIGKALPEARKLANAQMADSALVAEFTAPLILLRDCIKAFKRKLGSI